MASIGKVTAALNVHEQQLGELIGNFNTFFRAFAAQSASLRATVAELPSSLRQHRPRPRVAGRLVPADADVRQRHPSRASSDPATVTAALPWIEQVQASLAPNELGGVAKGLAGGDAVAGAADERTDPLLQADRTVQQMPDQT